MILNLNQCMSQNIFYCMHWNKSNANVYLHAKLLFSFAACDQTEIAFSSSTGFPIAVLFGLEIKHCTFECVQFKKHILIVLKTCVCYSKLYFSTIARLKFMCISMSDFFRLHWRFTCVENVSLYFSWTLRANLLCIQLVTSRNTRVYTRPSTRAAHQRHGMMTLHTCRQPW